MVANNLTGGFLMMRELFNQCMQQHGGAIVNMTADFRNGMPEDRLRDKLGLSKVSWRETRAKIYNILGRHP